MNRAFFMIDSDAMKRHGIQWNDGSTEIAKALGNKNGALNLTSMIDSFPFIDKKSLSSSVDHDKIGAIVGWDFDVGEAMACYYGKFINHPAIYFLDRNGQSVDAPAMIEKGIGVETKAAIKAKVSTLLDENQFIGKPIAAFDYDDFIQFVKHETNYYGETSSAFLALSVGNGFFAQDAQQFKTSGIAIGNYSSNKTKSGMIMDAFDYIAREFPGRLDIEKDPLFYNGPNKEANRPPVVRANGAKGLLEDAISAVSKLSQTKNTGLQR